MKLEIDIDEDYYKIICKRVQENKPFSSPYEYEVIADGKPIEQEPIIDRIRAEIMSLDYIDEDKYEGTSIPPMIDRDDVLDILDKYKGESEVEDGNDK